jgi:hypothetical protein
MTHNSITPLPRRSCWQSFFALDKFVSNLLGSKVIIYLNHVELKYLFSKKDAKSCLILWILLLQEFDIEIWDKKGSKNVMADNLFR